MQQKETLSGTVDRIIFQSAENGFSVFILQINSNSSTTVRGYLPAITAGEQVQLSGSWTVHPKFGKQFQADDCTKTVPTSLVGLKKYLGSGLIKGIGPTYAEKLVNCFGDKVLDIIDQSPEKLSVVPGIGPKRIEKITHAWKDQKEVANIMVFLREKDISATYAAKIYKRYGKESIAFLTENPYRLSQDIWGIGFKIADQIAQNLGIPADSVKRVKAAMHHVILQEVGNGHLYVELDNLKAKTTKLLELDATILGQKMKNGLHELYNTNEIKLISHDNQHFVTSPQNYFSEKGCALKIQHLLEHKSKLILDTNKVYEQLRTAKGEVELNDDQQKGIMACLTNKVSIITGGPGTGKTTLIKQLLNALDLCNTKYRLAAPTGRAAKRMAQSTRRDAMTIHRLLEFDVSTYRFTKNEQDALNLDFLIIDEASMIDIFLANAILKAVPLDAHVVFIGDIHQLPSVGAGNFLNDLITSEKVNCTRLTKIFRQAQDSMIVVNAHRINQGEFPTSSLPGTRRDFIFIKEDDPANVAGHLQNIFTKEIKKLGFTPDQVNVLVPMNRGVVGTQTINSHLQEILNPATNQKHVMRHGTAFRVNDRVIQLRNNYDKLVFNGDMGTITEIDITEQQLHIQFGGRVLEYEFSELDELFLAYAITIHKSQGSEYPVVIIPIFMQHFTLLQRNLIYTAITRAKKLCIFIGQTKAIAMAIKNNKGLDRKTFLQQFLTSDLQAR